MGRSTFVLVAFYNNLYLYRLERNKSTIPFCTGSPLPITSASPKHSLSPSPNPMSLSPPQHKSALCACVNILEQKDCLHKILDEAALNSGVYCLSFSQDPVLNGVGCCRSLGVLEVVFSGRCSIKYEIL